MFLLVQQALLGHRNCFLADLLFGPLMTWDHILFDFLPMNLITEVSQIVMTVILIITSLPNIFISSQIMMKFGEPYDFLQPAGHNIFLGTIAANREEMSLLVIRMSLTPLINKGIFSEFYALEHLFFFI